MIEVDALIKEMQDLKVKNPTLELPDILSITLIKTIQDLRDAIERVRMSNG